MATVIKTIPVQLDLGQRYAIRVRTVNSFGVSSDWSESLFVQIGDSVASLPPPTGFNVIPGINSLIVNWDLDTDGDISKYEIHAVPGAGNFFPSSSTLVGVVSQSNSFIFTSVKVNGQWTQLSEGDVYTVKVRKINSAGDTSAFTSPKQATVGAVDDSLFLKHVDVISAEEGVLPTIYVLSSQPTTAIPGDIWIQSNVVIPATPTGDGPLPPESFIVIDDTISTSPTTARLTWSSDWITVNSVEKLFVYRAVGSNSTELQSISKANSTDLDKFLIASVPNPTSNEYVDDFSIDATPVFYRIAGSNNANASRPNGQMSVIGRAPDDMRNGKPRPITSLITSTTIDSVAISFTAPASWYDPANPNYLYDLVNTVTGATVSSSFYSDSQTPSYLISGLQANTLHNLAIKAVDVSDLQSDAVSTSFTTAASVALQPLTLTASNVTSSSMTLTWTVSSTEAQKNIRYELIRTAPTSVTIDANIAANQQTSISYNVSGLSAGQSYTFEVRAVNAAGASPYRAVTQATVADSDPPPLPAINWFKPYYAGASPTNADYGKMYVDVTWQADAVSSPTTYVVERKVDSGNWETAYESTTAQARISINATAYSAGQTVQVRVWSKDALNNSNQANAPTASYTLIASPTLITATTTANYNSKWGWNGTIYDDPPNFRYAPAQGYYSTQDSTYNMTGVWGYSSGVTNVSKFESQLKDKTIVSATIYLRTSAPTSYSGSRSAPLIMHNIITRPALAASAPLRSSITTVSSVLPYNSAKEVSVPVSFIDSLKNGEWKGIGVYLTSNQTSQVASFYNVSGTSNYVDSKSGRVTVYHLG